MDKLGRNYVFTYQARSSVGATSGQEVEVRPPFTLEFDIQRNLLSSANTSSIRLYNLSPANRNILRKDITDYDLFHSVQLRAGYGQNMPTIFQGNVNQARSFRQKVDFITDIQNFDGGFALVNGASNQTFQRETPNANILRSLMNDLPGVSPGAVGDFPGSTVRGSAYSGRTADLLKELSNNTFFIDNGKAHCLGESECIQGSIEVLDASTGLLGTPVREQNILNIEIMFEPRVLVGQKIELRSLGSPSFNGFYRINSIHHRGMISESVCGDAITMLGLAYGTEGLQVIF